MKTLLFLRHAKSDWDAPAGGGDHARPLAKKGRKAARRLGRFMAAAELVPERALTSTAVRAQTTLDEAMEAGGWADVPFLATDALYEAGPADVVAQINAVPDDAEVLLVVGHEPTFSALVGRLSGGATVELPPGTLARVEVDAERWAEVGSGPGALTLLIPPKVLRGLKLKRPALADDLMPDGPMAGDPMGGDPAADASTGMDDGAGSDDGFDGDGTTERAGEPA